MDLQSQYSSIPNYIVESQNLQLQLQPTEEQNDQYMVERFMNVCATIIQKFYRGYLMRKKHYFVVSRIQRFHDTLWSVIIGWRVRKIMKLKRMQDLVQEMKTLIWKRRELIFQIRDNLPKIPEDYESPFMRHKEKDALKTAINGNQQYKFLSNELDPYQKEFITTINRLVVTGLWVYEDRHYKKNVQTIVTNFTIIDQSKHTTKEPITNSQQQQFMNRTQFVTPTQSQYLSPQGRGGNQSQMVYVTPNNQQSRVGFYPQQSQQMHPQQQIHNSQNGNGYPPYNITQSYAIPDVAQVQSMYPDQYQIQQQQYQQPDYSQNASTVQLGSTRQVQIERKLNYNQQSQEDLQQRKQFEEGSGDNKNNLPPLPTHTPRGTQQNQNSNSNSGSNSNTNKPQQAAAPFSKQNSNEIKQDPKVNESATQLPNQKRQQNPEQQDKQQDQEQEQQQQDKSKGFNWDDIPVGGQGKKRGSQFDEQAGGYTITTDIKPTIPKRKLQQLKEQQKNEEEDQDNYPSRKVSDDNFKEKVKKTQKGKVLKKQEEDIIVQSHKSIPRSQTEFPLVYQGDLDSGTHKSKSKNKNNNDEVLTQEEKEAKEKKEKLEKIKNLKKRMKYDPRKAIQKEKNQEKREEDENRNNTQEDESDSDNDQEEENEEVKEEMVKSKKKAVDSKMRSQSSHVPSKKEKENAKSEKEEEKNNGNFLKRQSQNMPSQKLSWKKTESRVDCWSSWNKRSKNYNTSSQTNFINNTPTKRKITLSSQNQQSARSNGNGTHNEFSFAHNKLQSVTEAQQFQQKVRNKFGLNGQSNDKNFLPSQQSQQSFSNIKPTNILLSNNSQVGSNQKMMSSNSNTNIFETQPSASFMKLPNIDFNSLQNISTGDLLKLREALIPIIQTNLIFIEQNDSKIFTKIAKEILKSSTNQ